MKKVVILALVALLSLASCSFMCLKKPKLKNTRWVCEYKEFVADVGNETVTVTLHFVSAKEFELEFASVMPPYPAMHMNADGTVDTMPGYTRQYSIKGTYKASRELVTLTEENGETKTLQYVADKLVSNDLSYQTLVFEKATNEYFHVLPRA